MIQYLLIAIFSSVFYLLYRQNQRRKYISECLRSFDGPPPKFFIGNVLEFSKNSVANFKRLYELQCKYGPISKLFIGPTRTYLLVSDPELVEVLLTSPKHLNKSADYQLMSPWLMNGLLLSKGRHWQNRRKIITPAFHFKILGDFLPVMNTGSDVLVEKLLPEVGKEVVDIHPYIVAYTLDTLCETAMGTTINAQHSPNNKYFNAVKIACAMYVKRRFSVWKKNDFLFQFSNDFKLQKEALDIIHGFARSVIEKRRNDLLNQGGNKETTDDTGVKRKTAFLDLLLESTVDGEGLSDSDILEEVETFMFGGHDTTSATICYALYQIARHPHVQDKIIEELKDVFANDVNRQPSMQDFNNMKYLELVIKETMRTYTPVPYISRELGEDLEFKGTVIPKDVTITVFTYHMHNRPDLFENPEEFNPDRFLFENLSLSTRNHFAYIPFSAGVRNCIGQKFAMFELKAVISKILRNFKVLAADSKYNVVLSGEIILKPKNGVSIRLERRQF